MGVGFFGMGHASRCKKDSGGGLLYLGKKLFEGAILLHLPQLRFDRVDQTGEETITVAVKRHLARLHQYQYTHRDNASYSLTRQSLLGVEVAPTTLIYCLPVRVCFSATLPRLFPISLSLSAEKKNFPPVNFTYKLDLQGSS